MRGVNMFRHTVVRSAMILTLAGFITRVLGFFYRIFMSDMLGAEGMGLYQLISPVYMLVWAFTSAGLSTAVSKLTAEQKATGGYGNIHRLIAVASAAALVLSLTASLMLYIYAPLVCTQLLKDSRVTLSMRILALCFPFMAVGSCIRGRFYGIQDAKVPAQCQVLEQCTRMGIVYLLWLYIPYNGLEYACAMAVTGMAVGEVISFLYALLRTTVHRHRLSMRPTLSYKKTGMMLFALALPLTLNRVTGTLLSAAENLLIPSMLQLYGLTRSDSVALYGKLCGMAMPLVMFPSSLLTALATALMPAVSEADATGDTKKISSAVEKSLTFTCVVGIGTAGLLLTLPGELGFVIYKRTDIGALLKLLGFICPFIYLQVTLSGILNGLGRQLYIFTVNLLSSLFNIGFICLFVPKYGINAFILGLLISTSATTFINLWVTSRYIRLRLYFNNIVLKPLIAITLSCMSLIFFISSRGIKTTTASSLCAAIAFIGTAYIVITVLLGVFGKGKSIDKNFFFP